MVAIGNPATMNDINRIHGSNSGNVGRGGGEEGNLLVNMPPQQHQKNSLNMTRTTNGNNGDNLKGIIHCDIKKYRHKYTFLNYVIQIRS